MERYNIDNENDADRGREPMEWNKKRTNQTNKRRDENNLS